MKKQKGFLIIEVLLAIVILSMVFLTLFTVLSFTTNRTERSKYDSQAASILQQGVELTRTTLLANWASTAPGTYYPIFDANTEQWSLVLGSEGVLQGRFTRSIKIASICRESTNGLQIPCPSGGIDPHVVDSHSKAIDVTISWKEGTVDKTVQTTLLVFNNKS